jgi:O-antigen ligase
MERSTPAEAADFRARPSFSGGSAGPSKPETLGFGILIVLLLAICFWAEIATGGVSLMALLVSGILVYSIVCLVSLEVAFALILAATAFSMEVVFPGTGSALQLPTEPMLFVALAVWLLRFLSRGSTGFNQPLLTAVLFLALGACLFSIVDTAYLARSLKATANAVWYALFGVFIYNNFRTRDRLKVLIAAWFVAGTLICLYSLINVLTGNFEILSGYWNAYPFFTEHGKFAAYLSFVCILALALAIETEGLAKLGYSVIAFLSGIQIVLSLTRGAWMGMAAAIAFLAVVSGRRLVKPGNILLGVVGATGLFLAIILSGAITRVEKQTRNITDASYVSNLERINRWYAGWNMFRKDPLNGVGYGTYSDNYRNFRRFPVGTEQSAQFMGVHSEYLRVLSETGVAGFLAAGVALLAVVLMAARAIRRARDAWLRGLAVGMAGGLLAYLVHAFVNDYIAYDKAAVPVWAAVGILGAIDLISSET